MKKKVDSAPPESCALGPRLVGLVEGPVLGSRLWLAGLWWRRDAFAAKIAHSQLCYATLASLEMVWHGSFLHFCDSNHETTQMQQEEKRITSKSRN